MEEIDELRAKAIASMPSSSAANPSSFKPKSPAREEGELELSPAEEPVIASMHSPAANPSSSPVRCERELSPSEEPVIASPPSPAANPSSSFCKAKSPARGAGELSPVNESVIASMPSSAANPSSSFLKEKSPAGGEGEISPCEEPEMIATMPSSAANPTSPSLKAKSPTREEGELSAGDEPELPTCSTAPSNSATLDEPIAIAPRRDNVTRINHSPASGSTMTNMQLPVSIRRNNSKHLKMKQAQFKFRNSRTVSWHSKGSNDNLVIRFSDDDSGSDSEDLKLENNANKKVNRSAKFKMPLASTRTQLNVSHRPVINRAKLIQNKGFVSHSSVSPATEIRGAINGHPVASSAEKDPRFREHNLVTKSSPSQEHEHIQDDRRLESLRHQIAVRENELKVNNKSMLQSKESLTDSYGDQEGSHAMKLDTQAASISRPVFVRTIGLTPNERAMKRLKLDDSLVLTTSANVHNFEASPKRDSTFTTKVYCDSHQSSMRANPVDPSQNQTLCLTRIKPNVDAGVLCRVDTPIRRNLSSESLRSANISRGVDFPDLLRNKDAKTGGVPMETSDRILEKRSVHAPDSQLGIDEVNISGMGSKHLESLVKLEEQQNKELDEAQELRRRCEHEERGALKAYRIAQMALVDANERCVHLYRKRELFSAQIRALTIEASSSMWPSSWQNHNQKESVVDSAKAGPSSSFGLLYNLDHQRLAGQASDCLGHVYNNQCSNGAYQQISGHEFGSDQCRERDASRSTPTAANDICGTTNHPNMSADENGMIFPFDRKSVESRLVSNVNDQNHGGIPAYVTVEGETLRSSEIAQDYELLEATLRSKLVARLGARTSSKINDASNAECIINKRAGITDENKKILASYEQRLEKGENLMSDMEGTGRTGRGNSQLTAHFRNESCDNSVFIVDEPRRNIDTEENNSSLKKFCWSSSETTPSSLLPSNLRIISRHAKYILSGCCSGSPATKERGYLSRTSAKEAGALVQEVGDCTKEYSLRSIRTGELDSHKCDFGIDPFRPFCIYELRGKCNNEECPWQHVKNCTIVNVNRKSNLVTSSSDGWISHLSAGGKSNDLGPCHHILQVPTYKIGSELINIDSSLSWSVLARSNWLYWQRGFRASFPSPIFLERVLPSDAPFSQPGDGPVADDYSRNDLSLCFHSQDGTVKQFEQGLPDSEQLLEMTLDLFDGKAYKPNRKKVQALSWLSRAIEADRNSVAFWVVYLHIFYRKEKVTGKDDMFLHAVQNTEDSYDLWLMYINSRMLLGDRLNAYDYALTSFCQSKDTCDKDGKYTSACILDIFLQMVDFLCMSGNVDKAASRIYHLLPTTLSENSKDALLSNVLSRLILSDKCIFWLCCIYLVIYAKLPEPVIQKFEFEKDLSFGIEWASVQLPIDKKDRVLELMKLAVDSTALDIDVVSHRGDQTDLRSLQFLAINHIRCVATLEGLDSSADLLVKYIKLYPACIELVLMSARLQNCAGDDDCFRGFEEALCNWPTEYNGCQCLWNQYAEHALENRGLEFAEKLMARWFESFWKGKDPCTENLECAEDGADSTRLPADVQSDGSFHCRMEGDAFGFLNLFLYRMLQNNLSGARLAIDKALELAAPMDYKHCVREHAAFIHSCESDSKGILNKYLEDSRASPLLESLSRRYYRTLKKPRIRQLIDYFLGPVSRDFSLMNSVLEVSYGSSLIPEKFGGTEDLVDLVSPLMETMPANYELALSVYRSTCRNFSHGAIRFWASSVLMNSILQTVPAAPEYVWLEAALALRNSENLGVSLRFHQHAVSVYPFSIKLWQSYLDLSRTTGNANAIVEAARERGVELAQISLD